MLQKLSLTGKRIFLRTPTRDDLPILYNLIYGVENPEWKKYDAPYYPLEFCTFEKFSKRMEERMNVTDVPSQMTIEHQGQIIGMVSYYWEDKRTRWLEMGSSYILLNIEMVDLEPKHYLYGLTISLKI